jgi:hypothetical protein
VAEEGDVAADEGEAIEEGEALDEEIDLPSGPLLAPAHGAEELTRSDDERTMRAAIPGRRDDRERRRHRDRGKHEHKRPQHAPAQHGAPSHAQRPQPQPQPQPQAPGAPQAQPQAEAPPTGRRGVLDAIFEILRGGDGRPIHVRHLTDLALKKRLLDGQPNEVVRQVRAALVRELRDREADGLRARVRNLGGGNWALVDRKLDPELAQAERELADKAARQREATRLALRRRLGRLSPASFEALGRALLDKLGVVGIELVRRGEGVAYFGGQHQLGVGMRKTLVALRPGEADIHRRAVGELRAGLAARGYDEGLLLAAGRLNDEGRAELKAGGGVVVHDGQSLAALLVKHGLGVRRLHLPVEYLDLELLAELTEG